MKMGDIIEVGADAKPKAIVTDQYYQVDRNQTPFIVKTEFTVKNVETGIEKKAVLHTYLTTTFFMIQGKGQEDFFEDVMKMYIEQIMRDNYTEIIFINKVLKSFEKTQKRKAAEKK